MPLILTEEQGMLQDAARGFLTENAPVSHLRHLRDSQDPDGFSRDLWSQFGEMGFAGVLIEEADGGSNLGAVEAGVIAEALGRTLTPSPYLSTSILSTSILKQAGSEAQKALLKKIAAGETVISLALDEKAKHNPERTVARAEWQKDHYLLNGAKTFVLDGHVADHFIVAAILDEEMALFLVPSDTPGLVVERSVMVDSHNAARLRLTDVKLGAEALIGKEKEGKVVLDQALDLGRACVAASLLGAADEVFRLTLDYLKTRQQFGRLIGEFQALQHRAAHLYTELELVKAVVLGALQALDQDRSDRPQIVAAAKAKAGRVAELAVQEAVQMHGGVGMTDALDIGFYMKRVRVLNETLGDADYHADRLAQLNAY